MSFIPLNYGNTAPTTLSLAASATQVTLAVNEVVDWPEPFYEVVVDRGNLSQEVCLVGTGTTTTILNVIRNFDGNGEYAHEAGATVEMSDTAFDWNSFNLHATDVTRDDHPNLMKSNGERHNQAVRHLMGISLPGGPPTISAPGDQQSDGTGASLAYADHVHPRADTWATYLTYMIRPGMIFPARLGWNDPRFIVCDGSWYNQSDWPILFLEVGQAHAPIQAGPTASTPFNPLIHFSVPQITWPGIEWVIMASFE
jgi:hypothetical protein